MGLDEKKKFKNHCLKYSPLSFPAPIRTFPTSNQQEQNTFSQVCMATSCADFQGVNFSIKKKKRLKYPLENARDNSIFSTSQQSVCYNG